ncbi:MAG TPA: nuclear transport factor 2 family protein [Candidatus Krumholzibacteria bacterium]|nr:nuclear transport factor 2 family protein [Candidatus Krumholzibacteria bacterium]
MTALRILPLLLLLTALPGHADERTALPADDVTARERAWAAALEAPEGTDLEAVDEIMHPDFRLLRTYGEAAPISKEAYLGMTGMDVHSAEITSSDVRVTGHVAVAHVTMTMDWSQEGRGALPSHFELVDVWVQDDTGTWKVISRTSQLAD